MPDDKIEGVKGLSLTADGTGAVFDVPADDVDAFLEGKLYTPFRADGNLTCSCSANCSRSS